jgi:hypothetical protein
LNILICVVLMWQTKFHTHKTEHSILSIYVTCFNMNLNLRIHFDSLSNFSVPIKKCSVY